MKFLKSLNLSTQKYEKTNYEFLVCLKVCLLAYILIEIVMFEVLSVVN